MNDKLDLFKPKLASEITRSKREDLLREVGLISKEDADLLKLTFEVEDSFN